MTAADPPIGSGDHHLHPGLADVEAIALAGPRLLLVRDYHRDRGSCVRDMAAPGPDFGELTEHLAVGDDDEVPRLMVLRRRRDAAGLEHTVEVLVGDRSVGELADVAPSGDGIPGLHLQPPHWWPVICMRSVQLLQPTDLPPRGGE